MQIWQMQPKVAFCTTMGSVAKPCGFRNCRDLTPTFATVPKKRYRGKKNYIVCTVRKNSSKNCSHGLGHLSQAVGQMSQAMGTFWKSRFGGLVIHHYGLVDDAGMLAFRNFHCRHEDKLDEVGGKVELINLYCGAGGSRTLVRTRKPYAFYTLIPAFIFVPRQDLDHQPRPYPLKFHQTAEARPDYFRFTLRR